MRKLGLSKKGHWIGDANWTISWLYAFLKIEIEESKDLPPPELFLQLDNCVKDNKNKFVYFFLFIFTFII